MINIIDSFGGDVIKFAGDALLIVWEELRLNQKIKKLCRIATECAIQLTRFQFDFSSISGILKEVDLSWIHLQVKATLSMGEMYGCLLGGHEDRWEFILLGKPLREMSIAEEIADVQHPEKRIIVSNEIWENVCTHFSTLEIIWKGITFHSIINMTSKFAPSCIEPEYYLDNLEMLFDSREIQIEVEIALQCFLSKSILKRMKYGLTPSTLADIRYVSVVFINLKNVNIESPECFSLLQTAFYSIEELLHWNEGSLRQFIVDDKGAVAIGVFGYPHSSHDNDAVRAVNFALAIKNKFRTLCIDYSIGITSGNAFCGTIGSHNRHEYTIIGDIVNLSARLMCAASSHPERLYVEHSTYIDACKVIQFQELGKIRVKGKSHPIIVYLPSYRSHMQFLSTPQIAKFKCKIRGRDHEMMLVKSLIEDVSKFNLPQFVLFQGIAGIGKSSLLREIAEMCSPFHIHILSSRSVAIQQTPYYMWTPIIREIIGLTPEEPEDEARKKFEKAFHKDAHLLFYLPLLDPILLTEHTETEELQQIKGEIRAQIIEEMMVDIILLSSKEKPLLFLLDDIQWIDASSLQFLRRLSQISNLKALFILTARKEPKIDLKIRGMEVIVLDPLEDDDLVECVQDFLTFNLSTESKNLIISKANGNPLFALSLAQLLVEKGHLVLKSGSYEISQSYPRQEKVVSKVLGHVDDTFPSTVEKLIISRFDILEGQQQLILQIASVIGFVFSKSILYYLIPELNEKLILEHLHLLTEKGFLRVSEIKIDSNLKYSFEHIVIQEVIYNSISVSKRISWHLKIAQWYENRLQSKSPETVKRVNYVSLAWHYQEASIFSKAMKYFGIAGENAFRQHCPQEASILLQEAVKLSEKFTNSSQLSLVRWHRMLGDALFFQGKINEAESHLLTVLELTKNQSGYWGTRSKTQVLENIQFIKKKIIVLMLFPQLRNGRKIESEKFPIFWEILNTCRRLYYLYFKENCFSLAILNLLMAFECILKVGESQTLPELEEHFNFFLLTHLTCTVVRNFLNRFIFKMILDYGKKYLENEIVQNVFSGSMGFRGMWGNFPSIRWQEIIEMSKQNLEKLYILAEQADLCRIAISTSYFYSCQYEEGETFSKHIYELAKNREHKSHEEIGLRHHSYHLLRQGKTQVVKTITKYLVDNELIKPNCMDEFDLYVRNVMVMIQENSSLKEIEKEYNKAIQVHQKIHLRSFVNELICLACFYDELFFLFQVKRNKEGYEELSIKILDSLRKLLEFDSFTTTPLIFLIEGDLAYFVQENPQRAILGWNLSLKRSIMLKMKFEETKARLRIGQYFSSSENLEKVKELISSIGPHWLLETACILKNTELYNQLTTSYPTE